eukprot:m.23096 g.23096  ORF g.23096 m.23096 type:complete len:641 (+) comp9430_c0_seq1:136-2058(+)
MLPFFLSFLHIDHCIGVSIAPYHISFIFLFIIFLPPPRSVWSLTGPFNLIYWTHRRYIHTASNISKGERPSVFPSTRPSIIRSSTHTKEMKATTIAVLLCALAAHACADVALVFSSLQTPEQTVEETNARADVDMKAEACGLFDASWGALDPAAKYELAFVDPPFGCNEGEVVNITNGASLQGRIAVFERGSCFFSTKVLGAASYGAAGVIIASSSGLITPIAANASDYVRVDMPVVMVDHSVLHMWREAETDSLAWSVSFRAEESSTFDPNFVVFFLAAWLSLISASVWVTSEITKKSGAVLPLAGGSAQHNDDEEEEAVHFNLKHILVMVVFASLALVLIYFLYKYLVYAIIVLFVISASVAVQRILMLLPAGSTCLRTVANIPKLGSITMQHAVTFCIAWSLGIWWFVVRHATYAWVLQDLLGLAFMVSALQTLRLPSFRVATALLSAFLLYDVFFVFITPYLTKDRDSVMVKAATGGGTSSESLPLVLRVPRFSPSCFTGDSLLGFGDIIIPGLAVVYCAVFDIHKPSSSDDARQASFLTRHYYLVVAIFAYSFGLACTYIALASMQMAQPALLYLSPSVLLSLTAAAALRGELNSFWMGQIKPKQGYKALARARSPTLQSVNSEDSEELADKQPE